ncbi:MAG: type III polyketide synthase [Rhodospirillales bacterium]|nr:type III polyketide synthase [Rhodospirillales bacterium]
MSAFINRIGTATPAHDIHAAFVAFASAGLAEGRNRTVFERMAARSAIAHRYSHLRPGDPAAGEVDAEGFYRRGRFPGTAARMAAYAPNALALARAALAGLAFDARRITHLIVASCTGFTAPGLDLHLIDALGLRADVARTMLGFMGCAAAVPALRLADQAVRADPAAQVLVVNLELCSLHLQETADVEAALAALLFGDGCSAALVSAEPVGVALGDFRTAVLPDSAGLITWTIGDHGFEMHLSGQVPGRIAAALRAGVQPGSVAAPLSIPAPATIDLWAVHGGGRSVLDAVQIGLDLPAAALRQSRAVLHDHGNMSSATIMFTLARMLADGSAGQGMAMAFGPGMVAETFRFALPGRS